MPNPQNLKHWQPGQSGNPKGRAKGSRNLSSQIREMLENEEFIICSSNTVLLRSSPIKVIVSVLIEKAITGDLKAFDLLAKYGYGNKIDITLDDTLLPTPILNGFSNSAGK